MYCKNCGNKIDDDKRFCGYGGVLKISNGDAFCVYCGKPIPSDEEEGLEPILIFEVSEVKSKEERLAEFAKINHHTV